MARIIEKILEPSKIATMELLVMNNNKNDISNISILGRIPFKNNKTVLSNNDLDTTVDTKLKSEIRPLDKNITVWADEFKIEEVITNYLTNAIHHIDENKLIKIYTSKINEDIIRLNVYNSGEQLSDENLINVWEKFYKTDKARTRAYGGIGLGLSIVKAIAEKHNTNCGCININEDNMTKKGVIFYFDLNTK